MPRILTVAKLIDRGRKRADQEDSDLLSDAEWKQNLSTVFGELHEEVAEPGMRYYETEATIVANGSASYALPVDHLSTIGIDGEVNAGGQRYPLRESMMQERNRHGGAPGSGQAREFAIVGTNIELYPVPTSGSYYHTYIPQAQDLSEAADSVEVDVVNAAGENFVVYGLAVLAKAKEESDTRFDQGKQAEARATLRKWVIKRSFITPRRVMVDDEGYWP